MSPRLDPLTFEKRGKFFKKTGYVKTVTNQQKNNELNFVKRAMDLPAELEGIAEKYKSRSSSDISLRQGLHINGLTAALTDAYLDAKYEGINNFEALPKQERSKIWKDRYNQVFERMIKPHLKGHLKAMNWAINVEKFLTLPDSIFQSRERKGKLEGKRHITKRVKIKMKKYGENPMQNFLAAINRVMERKQVGLTTKGKAMRVCIAASVYADLMEEKGVRWIDSYRTSMRHAYLRLRRQPEIIDAIIELK